MEGSPNTVYDTYLDVVAAIVEECKKRRQRGVEDTENWLDDMLSNGYSTIYSSFPEQILEFEDKKQENELEFIEND
jgi:hypothetical protein